MADMNGRVCLITGATSGIGKEAAMALAKSGATLLLTARDMRKGEAVKREIVESSNNKDIELLECELASFDSVRNCCDRIRERFDQLHILINNAGTWENKRNLSKDGIELMFAVNYLAPFLMTNLLLDTIKVSAPARIINVSSGLYRGTIDFDDIEGKTRFRSMNAYRQSKLEMMLFTKEISNRLQGTEVTANCLMPGFVRTGLFRNSSLFTRGFIKLITKSPKKGARTTIYLATSSEVQSISGECFKKERIVRTSDESNDAEAARRLWDVSMGYVEKWLT